MASITSVDLTGLKKIGQGKVRDVFEVDDKTLLFVASDRVSAFDVVMQNGIPDKGAILTHASVSSATNPRLAEFTVEPLR